MTTTMNTNTQIGTTTWGKNFYTCGHWNLTRDRVTEVSPNNGYPIVARHDTPCANCAGV